MRVSNTGLPGGVLECEPLQIPGRGYVRRKARISKVLLTMIIIVIIMIT